jgi:putative heme-binding domain-containing protein
VRTLKLTALAPQVDLLFRESQAEGDTRLAAARALLACDADPAPLLTALADAQTAITLREQLAALLGPKQKVTAALVTVLKTAPHRLQQAIALALAGSPAGAGALLDAIAQGQAPATLLRQRALADRLRAANSIELTNRATTLTAKLPPANEQLDQQIAARIAAFAKAKPDLARGQDSYRRNCAVCHQLGNDGGLVGPQLDGVGNRGMERIVEDILDPNRNVDAAFRTQTLTRKDGTIATGLFRREEGAQLVLADFAGKEFTLPKADVQTRAESETSLMPPAFGELIPEAEFYDLLAYLISQRVTSHP